MSAIAKAPHRTPAQPGRGKRGQGRPTQADPEITKALIVAATVEPIRTDVAKWGRVIKEANINAD